MCELLGMSSDVPATVTLSLTTLASHGGPPASIRDGWGVAYYEDTDVRLIKDAGPASDSDWVRFIGEHDLRSDIAMAHIRKATIGEPLYRNAQPFTRELFGRMHLFAHNGWLLELFAASRMQPTRHFPVGDTDSEYAFCALLERMHEVWRQPDAVPPLDARLLVVSAFAEELRTFGPANFLYSDGDVLFAHGDRRKNGLTGLVEAPGLVFRQNWCRRIEGGFFASGVSVEGADQTITVVASVSLTEDPWQPIGEGEVIAISGGQVLLRQQAQGRV